MPNSLDFEDNRCKDIFWMTLAIFLLLRMVAQVLGEHRICSKKTLCTNSPFPIPKKRDCFVPRNASRLLVFFKIEMHSVLVVVLSTIVLIF